MDRKLDYVQSVFDRMKAGQLSRREGVALLHKAGISAFVAAFVLRMLDAEQKREDAE